MRFAVRDLMPSSLISWPREQAEGEHVWANAKKIWGHTPSYFGKRMTPRDSRLLRLRIVPPEVVLEEAVDEDVAS